MDQGKARVLYLVGWGFAWGHLLDMEEINEAERIRMEVCYVKYKIGDGSTTWTWLDWHPCDPLVQQFGARIIYDAGSNVNAEVVQFISNDEWNMPNTVSRDLITM